MSKKYKASVENTNKLSAVESQKPKAYDAKDGAAADSIARELSLTKPFSYNPETDAAYAARKKIYTENAENAMNDTMAKASALTGGYVNSFAQSAAQREYDRVMSEFESVIPELYNAAYERYRDGIEDRFDLLKSYRDSDNDKYSRYADSVKAWQDARDFYYNIIRDDIEDQQSADKLELDLQKVITDRLKAKRG